MQDQPRLAGPDTLRAFAIVLVYAYHYAIFVNRAPELGWLARVGWSGVDLFFVLSGYLIGEPLLRGLLRGERLSLSAFYARRATRTWPLFWLVLAAFFLMPGLLGGREPPPLWRFLSFTQNIGLQPGTAFSHAWSLCVEEQFYLVVPLLLLGARRLRLTRTQAWSLLALAVAAGMAWRSWLWSRYGREAGGALASYYPELYYATLCRVDEFLPGLALALLRHGHPGLWAALMARGRVLTVVGLAAVSAVFALSLGNYYIEDYGYGFWMSGPGYSLQAIAFALLLLAALSPASPLGRLAVPGARSLALWSYAIYLTHKPLGHVLKPWLAPLGAWPQLVLTSLACVALGALLHHAVERPVLRWRERRWPRPYTGSCRHASMALPVEIPSPPVPAATQSGRA